MRDPLPAPSILTAVVIATADDVATMVYDWRVALELRVQAGELSSTTRQTYLVGVAKFLAWCREQCVDHVDPEAVLKWKADLIVAGVKPGAFNTWLAGVRAFFKWAKSIGRMGYNPVNGVKGAKRKSRKHARQALTDAEVLLVLDQPDRTTDQGKRDYALLTLMAYTGARTVEVHRADLKDLRSEAGKLVLGVRGKGRDEVDELVVVASARAERAMIEWLAVRGDEKGPLFVSLSDRSRGDRLGLSAIRKLVKGYFEQAGVVSGKSTHSLRHSAITSAIRRGAPLAKVQAMARHASVETTMVYFDEVDRVDKPAEEWIGYGEEG